VNAEPKIGAAALALSKPEAEKNARPSPETRLANLDAVLSRSDLRELGYERRAVDAIFRSCPVISIPGYSRPLIRVADFHEFLEQHTYRGDRVRPCQPARAVL
jgi:hypothetical protein